nr:retrovirus-related Pol polyprotein from transposon TNT 1-94 [Tanacetum cinerariifolium]
LFSVSQMCDKKNNVLFTDTECVVLSLDFKLLDDSQVLLRVPRKDNMYSVDLKNVALSGGLTCLFAKATLDESNLWHMRLGHINFKTMNKLVRGNLIRGIKREFSVARTPQQNGVAKRKNRTLIEAARTILADLKLHTTFWTEAVNTACYVQNRVLVIKPHNKAPYELFHGRTRGLSFMRPFGCHVTILNTLDHLGKFNGEADERFFVGYFVNSKEFRVFNSRTRIVEKTLHITFLENKPNIAGSGPTWLFDINTLIKSMNYKPVVTGNQSNGSVCKARVDTVPDKDYILYHYGLKPSGEEEKKDVEDPGNKDNEVLSTEEPIVNQEKDANTLVDLPTGERAIGTKWIYRNKKDERGIVVKNKARLVAQGYTQEEGIDYDEVFAPVARIEAIRLFLAYALFKDFIVYHMDVKSAFMYSKIEEEVYVYQPSGFEDPEFPLRVYKVEKVLYGLHQAPRAWKEMCTEFEKMMRKKFQMSSMGELTFFLGLQVTQKDDGIFISQDKSMIGSLMYLTSSRPDIMFVDTQFNLEAYTDSDYVGASLDRKSTTGGCQFLRSRLISWQCKKQTVVANSTTKAEYVAASNCCRQV